MYSNVCELDEESWNSRTAFELTEVSVDFILSPSVTKSMLTR